MGERVLKPLGRLLFPCILPVLLIAIWEFEGRRRTSVSFPPFSKVVAKLRKDWIFEGVSEYLVPSISRFTQGYVFGALLGIAIGVLIGAAPRIAQYLDPTLEFLRSVPPVAIIPIALLLFGLGNTMRIAVIIFGVFFPVLVNTTVGIRATRQERIDTARMYGLSRAAIVRRVMLPSAAPMISAGLRIALPIGLVMMVVSELIGANDGIGSYLVLRQAFFDSAGIYAAILILGVVANIITFGYNVAQRRLLPWAKDL